MRHRNAVLAGAMVTGLIALTACGGSSDGAGAPAQTDGTPGAAATLAVATDARLGAHVVDGSGRSLYYFAKDVPASASTAAVSNCNADCLPVWPIFHTDQVVAQGINQDDVGEITRSDGAKQTTYRGFPLYYFAGDSAPGDTRGEGLNGLWFVVHDPPYSIALLSKQDEAATYLTDGEGRTLYQFSRDTVGTSTTAPATGCTSAACMGNFPFFVTDRVTVPSGLVASDFAVFTRADGMQQSSYRGHPLYRHAGDKAPGETNGRAVSGWQTVDPNTR